MQLTAASQFPCTPASTPRKRRTPSSASSACIGPDEDWTKVTDFGERRRLQSRIVQRIYRMKQKQQMEQVQQQIQLESDPSTPDVTTTSASNLSCTDTQLPDLPNVFDIATPDMSEQPCPPLTSNINSILPLESLTPPISTSQTPCAHVSTPSTSTYFQPPTQPPHNLCSAFPRGAPQPHSQPVNHDRTAYSPHMPRQFASSGVLCGCLSVGYYPPPQRMHNCHGRMVPTGLEEYTRGPYEQFNPSMGMDLTTPYGFSPNGSSPCMVLSAPPPAPLKRGCCCCHHHGYAAAPAMGLGSFDGYCTQLYTSGTRGGTEHAAWPFHS